MQINPMEEVMEVIGAQAIVCSSLIRLAAPAICEALTDTPLTFATKHSVAVCRAPSTCVAMVEAIRAAWAGLPEAMPKRLRR